ncbi:hypothetical protein NDU88_002045 [Pleurodeles waltl]|uniref:Uncharacterized protein n=1 Tax=Pleurodeles waltl TaxID=8319 RepID=A0AAV7UUK3_PLEWA|nr:hypothetical protein NDU88_002045 [Pleurodeles waltl]
MPKCVLPQEHTEEIAARLPDFRSACLPVGVLKPGLRVPERRHPRHPRSGHNAPTPAAHDRWAPRTSRLAGGPGQEESPFLCRHRADPIFPSRQCRSVPLRELCSERGPPSLPLPPAPGDRSRDRITEGQGRGDLPVPPHPSVGDTKRSPRNPQTAASEEQNRTSYLLSEVPFSPRLSR